MVNYCKKCEAEVSPGNEFCGKCGERVIQKPIFINKKRMIIQSFYLTLGGIAAYLSLIFISIVVVESVEPSFAGWYYLQYVFYSILLVPTAILLIITYHGFIYSKRYTRFTGLPGCILLMIVLYWLSNDYDFGNTAILQPIILLISSIVLLIITLIFWKDV